MREFVTSISESMPADQEFASDVVAVSRPKSEHKFDEYSNYDKNSIDLARSARDKCVAETL
jgi:hypothetical protein